LAYTKIQTWILIKFVAMRFGRTRQSVIDPPKKRQKEFTDYNEYQRRLALYNDSTDAFEVGENMTKYFNAKLNAPQITVNKGNPDDVRMNTRYGSSSRSVVSADNVGEFTEFIKTPSNQLYENKRPKPVGERFVDDGLFYAANTSFADKFFGRGEVSVENPFSTRIDYENYVPTNKDNKPISTTFYGSRAYNKDDKYDATSEAVDEAFDLSKGDVTWDYAPYGASAVYVDRYAEPQVEPVFTGTPPSATPPPRKQESIVHVPVKEYNFTRPNVLDLIDPMPKIYSRKLNQQKGTYDYVTSHGSFSKKLGREDAQFYRQHKAEIDALRERR
jgi:hypothetical protein